MEPRRAHSAFTISFSNPKGFQNQHTVIQFAGHSAAGSSQLDVLEPRGCKRKRSGLSLGLGDSSSSDSSRQSMGTMVTGCTVSSANGSGDGSCMDYDINFKLSLGSEGTSKLHKQACDSKTALEKPGLDLKLSLAPSLSVVTDADLTRGTAQQEIFVQPHIMALVPTVDEGSTSLRRPSGGMVLSFLNQADKLASLKQAFPTISNQVQGPAAAETVLHLPKNPAACTSGLVHPQQRGSITKLCSYPGCIKGARGSSGRCIAHGGGNRCQRERCNKGAEGKTIFCKAHGGGRRCNFLGCTKSAEGRTDCCIAHGGGRRCSNEGCKRAARGKSGRCIKHGGGKRCQQPNCTKSAEGRSGFCIAHGGGRRCQYVGCNKGAQGSTNLCKAHGGGKRCTHPDCAKGAEGSTPFCKGHGGGKRCSAEGCTKSVHGGTQFCVAHGGGKRCVEEGCKKSARGRTDRCVSHGGGKRCQSAGCLKSAQGSTDFCKAHGGGKRCFWGHPGYELGSGGPPCDRLARKNGLCGQHNPLVDDHSVHGGLSFSGSLSRGDVPSSTERSRQSNFMLPAEVAHHWSVPVFEGRVHGGNILSMFADGMGLGKKSTNTTEASTSAPRNWKSGNCMEPSASRRSWL